MTGVLQRLESLIGDTPIKYIDGTQKTWRFSPELATKGVLAHSVLNIEYSLLCTRLVHQFSRKESNPETLTEEDKKELTEQLIAALAMAELLVHIDYYLYEPDEILRLQSEQEVYRTLLSMWGYEFGSPQKTYDIKVSSSFSQQIREKTATLNFPRLFAVRIRRVLMTLVPIAKDLQVYCRYVAYMDQFASPVLNYISWLFYIPRLFVNLVLLVKHVIPNYWMTQAEAELHWLTRLQAQLQRRGFELANDSVWFTTNLLCCFVLTGALAPVGMYLTVSIFFFDIIMAATRASIELGRLKNLQIEYEGLAKEAANKPELKEIEDYLEYLAQRKIYERNRLLLSVKSTSALFLGMCFALPFLAAISPIPFIGAILVLTITYLSFSEGKKLVKQKPSDKVIDLKEKVKSVFATSHVMFPPPSSSPINEVKAMEYQPSIHISSSATDLNADKFVPVNGLL